MDAAERTRLETTPAQAVERIERDLGLSTSEIAAALKTTPRTLERWRTDSTHPQRDTRRRLALLLNVDRRLRETFEAPEASRAWLRAPSPYLGGLTPADALRAGRADRVEAALEALDSGVFI